MLGYVRRGRAGRLFSSGYAVDVCTSELRFGSRAGNGGIFVLSSVIGVSVNKRAGLCFAASGNFCCRIKDRAHHSSIGCFTLCEILAKHRCLWSTFRSTMWGYGGGSYVFCGPYFLFVVFHFTTCGGASVLLKKRGVGGSVSFFLNAGSNANFRSLFCSLARRTAPCDAFVVGNNPKAKGSKLVGGTTRRYRGHNLFGRGL